MRTIAALAGLTTLILLGVFSSAFAEGEIYKFVDANGSVHFTTNLSEVPPAQRDAAQATAAARMQKSTQSAAPPAATSDSIDGGPPGSSPNGRVRSASHTPETFALLRDRLLKGTAASHGVDPKRPVWGVLMEEGVGGGDYYTLVALADGSGSIYFSTGGGVIGGKGVPAINAAARRMVERATKDLGPCPPADRACPGERPSLQPEKIFNPPGSENVRFWVLTPRGVYSALQTKKGLAAKRSPGWPLFYAGHEVMTGLREASER